MTREIDDHVATGKIDRAEKVVYQQTNPEPKEEVKVFGMENPSEFEMAVSRAKFNPGSFLYVDEELMKYLLRGGSDKSLIYHGVRLYIHGSKDRLDSEESMSAENALNNYRGAKGQND